MRDRANLSGAIAGLLAVALLSYAVSQACLSEARRWAGAHSVGATVDGPVYLWWSLWLPFSVGSAALCIGCSIAARRWFKRGCRSDAARLLFLGFLTWLGLWAAFTHLERGSYFGARPEGSRLWPRHPGEIFSQEQWNGIKGNERLAESPGAHHQRWAGLGARRCVIPHDEAILERYTFLGLPPMEVSRLFGCKPREIDTLASYKSSDPTIRFRMYCPGPEPSYGYWALELTFSRHSGVVRKERLLQRSRYISCGTR